VIFGTYWWRSSLFDQIAAEAVKPDDDHGDALGLFVKLPGVLEQRLILRAIVVSAALHIPVPAMIHPGRLATYARVDFS
jgi:hypothetical protein